jgi:hypothetical protein
MGMAAAEKGAVARAIACRLLFAVESLQMDFRQIAR